VDDLFKPEAAPTDATPKPGFDVTINDVVNSGPVAILAATAQRATLVLDKPIPTDDATVEITLADGRKVSGQLISAGTGDTTNRRTIVWYPETQHFTADEIKGRPAHITLGLDFWNRQIWGSGD
jgi:hypothetical protein